MLAAVAAPTEPEEVALAEAFGRTLALRCRLALRPAAFRQFGDGRLRAQGGGSARGRRRG